MSVKESPQAGGTAIGETKEQATTSRPSHAGTPDIWLQAKQKEILLGRISKVIESDEWQPTMEPDSTREFLSALESRSETSRRA